MQKNTSSIGFGSTLRTLDFSIFFTPPTQTIQQCVCQRCCGATFFCDNGGYCERHGLGHAKGIRKTSSRWMERIIPISSHDLYVVNNWLVVSTHLKDMLVKMGSSSPRNRGENKTHLSCHHLDNYGDGKSPNCGLRDPFHKAFSWLIIGVYWQSHEKKPDDIPLFWFVHRDPYNCLIL